MKVLTSITVFNDAIGKRMSITFSDVDETTGKVISDNNRIDRVVTDKSAKSIMDELEVYAQGFIDSVEG